MSEKHDHGCCEGSWTHSLDCANSTDPWRELEVVNARLAERTGEVQVAEAKVRELEKLNDRLAGGVDTEMWQATKEANARLRDDNQLLHKALNVASKEDRLPLICYENSVRDLQLEVLKQENQDLVEAASKWERCLDSGCALCEMDLKDN